VRRSKGAEEQGAGETVYLLELLQNSSRAGKLSSVIVIDSHP
jgi:hypothetical protein